MSWSGRQPVPIKNTLDRGRNFARGHVVKTCGEQIECQIEKPLQIIDLQGFLLFGGVDGTRTRDPRRDRPVF